MSAAALPAGRQEATLDLYTDDPYYRQLQVPVTLTREQRAAVTATPNVVRVRPGQAVSAQLVRLRPGAAGNVRIDTIEADDPGITCTWAAGPDTEATLKIRVDARRLAQPGSHAVRVRLAEPARDTVIVPVVFDAE